MSVYLADISVFFLSELPSSRTMASSQAPGLGLNVHKGKGKDKGKGKCKDMHDVAGTAAEVEMHVASAEHEVIDIATAIDVAHEVIGQGQEVIDIATAIAAAMMRE